MHCTFLESLPILESTRTDKGQCEMKWAYPLKGRTIREAMANEIQAKIGKPFHWSSLGQNHPYEIKYEGQCSWASTTWQRVSWNIHSWDRMKDCLKYGFSIADDGCVIAIDNDWNHKVTAGGTE